MFKGKLFRKIVLLFILMITVYSAVLIVIWSRNDSSAKNKQYDENNRKITENIRTDFDDKLRSLISISDQLMSNESIISFTTQTDDSRYGYDAVYAMKEIRGILTNFSNPDCSIIAVNTYPGIAAGTDSTTIEDYADSLGFDVQSFYSSVNNMPRDIPNVSRISVYEKGLVNNGILIFMNQKTLRGIVSMWVLVDKDYLISDYGLLDDSTLICQYGGKTVFTAGNTLADSDKLLNGNAPKYASPSQMFGDFSIILFPHNYSYFHDNFIMLLTNLIAGIILLIFITLIMNFGFRRIYKPIGEVVGNIKEYDNSNSNDEAQILKENFTNMKIQTNRLNDMISAHNEYQREKALRDILYGAVGKNNLENIVQKYSLEYLSDKITVTVVEFMGLDNIKNIDESLCEYEIKEVIIKYIKNNITFKNKREIFEINSDRFAIITSGYTVYELNGIMIKELGYIEGFYGILLNQFTAECGSIQEIKTAYFDASAKLDYNGMISESSKSNSYYYPFDFEKNLAGYVQQGNKDKVCLLVENIIHKNYQMISSPDRLDEFKSVLAMTVKRIAATCGEHFDESEQQLSNFTNIQNEQELIENFRCIFLQLTEHTEQERIKGGKTLMKNILAYIKNNYQKDISLTDIAQHFNISLGYISRLFRENMDTSFKDYLNRHRIETAKRIISENSAVKLTEVAEMVGFTNAVTFNRVFKKYELIAPSEFRNRISYDDKEE